MHNEGSILPTREAPPSQRMEPPTPPRIQRPSEGHPSTSEYSAVSLSFEVRERARGARTHFLSQRITHRKVIPFLKHAITQFGGGRIT